MMDCRAVLISDKRLFRDGLREMLAKSRVSVVGVARDVSDALATLNDGGSPNLVVMHVAADHNVDAGLALARTLPEHFPRAKVVVLADTGALPFLSSLVCSSVSAILLTDISSEMLQRSLELVFADHRLFPAEVMSLLTENSAPARTVSAPPLWVPGSPAYVEADSIGRTQVQASIPDIRPAELDASVPLSKREHQIVRCLAVGLSNKIIARKLNITEGTVKVHVKGLLRKIRATNRTQVAIWALRQPHLCGSESSADLQFSLSQAD